MLEASGWKGVAGTAIVNDPAVKAFVRERGAALAAEGKARVDRLLLDGRAIAATVTLQSGDTAWCWKIAYSEGLARFSPGVQLICDLTERLLAEPEVARVDSCAAADHPMIDHVWRERLTLSDRLIGLQAVGGAVRARLRHRERCARTPSPPPRRCATACAAAEIAIE